MKYIYVLIIPAGEYIYIRAIDCSPSPVRIRALINSSNMLRFLVLIAFAHVATAYEFLEVVKTEKKNHAVSLIV